MSDTEQLEASDRPSPGITLRIESIPWEPIVYGLLLIVAASMRLWDLGSGAYHHDEGLHSYYSWQLFQGNGFTHNPLLHGPFLFHLTAGGLFLFGDNLVAPRVFPALFGAALVVMPLFLRGYLGRWGALAVAVMLAFSPSIFYFSRYIRNDIFSLVFDFALIIAMWKYIDTRKNRYLYLGAAFLALTFSTKETSYITLAAVVSFLLLWWARDWLPVLWSTVKGSRLRRLRARLTFRRVPPHAGFLVLMATLTLPLFSAAFGWLVDLMPLNFTLVNLQDNSAAGVVGAPLGGGGAYASAAIIAAGLFGIGALIGMWWRRWTWLLAFGAFYAIFFVLHTTLFTNQVGLGSGIWQSLGYWIAQQSVERANQPFYYYFILLPLYELLPFTFGIAAVVAFSMKLGRWFLGWALVIAVISALMAASLQLTTGTKLLYLPLMGGLMVISYLAVGRGNKFDWFLVHWALISLLLYMLAGEKMPWLVAHIALPFAVLAGRYIGMLVTQIDWTTVLRSGGVVALFLLPVLLLGIRALVLSADWDRSPIGGWSFVGAMAFTLVTLAAGAGLWVKMGGRKTMQMVAVSIIAIMAVFSIRAGVQAAYVNRDDPKELLVYAGASDAVPRVIDRIDQLAEETGKGKELPILIDTGFSWPGYWYLRNYEKVAFQDMKNHDGEINADVVVLNVSNRSKINPSADRFTDGERVSVRIWFPRGAYYRYTAGKFFSDLVSQDSWGRMLNYFTYRTMGFNPDRDDAVVFFAKEPSSADAGASVAALGP